MTQLSDFLIEYLSYNILGYEQDLAWNICVLWKELFKTEPGISNSENLLFFMSREDLYLELEIEGDGKFFTFYRDRKTKEFDGEEFSDYKSALEWLKRKIDGRM